MNSINENLIKEDEEENIINRLSLTEEKDSGVYYNDFDYEIDKPIDSNIYKKLEYSDSFPDNRAPCTSRHPHTGADPLRWWNPQEIRKGYSLNSQPRSPPGKL